MSTTTTAGHLIVAQLERAGIQRVYGVPGESFLDVLDGLHGSSIETVVTRHEGGAGFMALAEGRLTELPGVAMVTRGPGAANAFIAIHTAHQDATPMILFVGLIPVADRGRESFQEFDINAWFGSTAKKVVTLDDAASAARVVDDAIFTALSGRPGPGGDRPPRRRAGPRHRIRHRGTPHRRPDRTGRRGPRRPRERSWPRPRKPLIVVGGEGWDQASSEALAGWASRHGVPVLADFRAYDAVPHCQRRLRRLPRLRPQRRQRPPPRRGRPAGLRRLRPRRRPLRRLQARTGCRHRRRPPRRRPAGPLRPAGPAHSGPRRVLRQRPRRHGIRRGARGRLAGRGPRRLRKVLHRAA